MQMIESFTQLEIDTEEDRESSGYLGILVLRISVIGLLYKMLYRDENIRTVSVRDYLTAIVDTVRDHFEIDNRQVHIDVVDMDLDLDTILPFGLIISEIMSRELRNASGPEWENDITVRVTRIGDLLELFAVASECQPGSPACCHPGECRINWMLIEALADQVNGTIEKHCASAFRMTLPL